MNCLYQCINGQLEPVSSDCPIVPCPQNGGPCDNEGGLVSKPCPRPFEEDKTAKLAELQL